MSERHIEIMRDLAKIIYDAGGNDIEYLFVELDQYSAGD